MKRVLIAVFSLLIFAANQAFAYNVKHFSNDEKIMEALNVLKTCGGVEVLDNLSEVGVRIQFCDLMMIDIEASKDFAISSLDSMGNRVILINTRYQNSPKEALACLIAHESFHKAKVATLAEEVKCTQKEAEYWHKLKNQVTNQTQNDLTERLNELERLYLASGQGQNRIEESIRQNEFYQEQLAIK